jgi:hypothetical protein
MLNVSYPYEVNGKLVTGNGSLIPISSLSNRSLLPNLTVLRLGPYQRYVVWIFKIFYIECMNIVAMHLRAAALVFLVHK